MQPEVSIIIPAYNTEKYIAKAIESALGQTLTNIEVIVVDDCSSDSTLEVVKSFTDPRLKLLINQKNLGGAAASNRALQIAQGKWVAVLDSDDWIAPERLERLVQVANARQADVIVDDLHLIRDSEMTPWSTLLNESDQTIDQIQQIDPVFFVETDVYGHRRCLRLGLTKPLFKREFLIEHSIQYDESLTAAYDFWIDMECFVQGACFILVPEAYYYYRSRPGSAVSSNRLTWLDECCRKTQDFMQKTTTQKNPALVKALSKHLARFKQIRAYYRVIQPFKQGIFSEALEAMIHNPRFFIQLLLDFPGIVERRIQYHLFRNLSAYEMLPRMRRRSKKQNSSRIETGSWSS